jgi:hypothetical protein
VDKLKIVIRLSAPLGEDFDNFPDLGTNLAALGLLRSKILLKIALEVAIGLLL